MPNTLFLGKKSEDQKYVLECAIAVRKPWLKVVTCWLNSNASEHDHECCWRLERVTIAKYLTINHEQQDNCCPEKKFHRNKFFQPTLYQFKDTNYVNSVQRFWRMSIIPSFLIHEFTVRLFSIEHSSSLHFFIQIQWPSCLLERRQHKWEYVTSSLISLHCYETKVEVVKKTRIALIRSVGWKRALSMKWIARRSLPF